MQYRTIGLKCIEANTILGLWMLKSGILLNVHKKQIVFPEFDKN